jgi:hypothetical protein
MYQYSFVKFPPNPFILELSLNVTISLAHIESGKQVYDESKSTLGFG